MKCFSSNVTFLIAMTIFSAVLSTSSLADDIKPCRVALIIADQWDDPAGFLINHTDQHDRPNTYVAERRTGRDFSSLVIMLKSWGIPFNIIRLDQEFMDINRFIGPDGKPNVGCIIFDAPTSTDPGNTIFDLPAQNYEVLQQAVNEYGISLIALADRINQPVIQQILGIKYQGEVDSADPLLRSQEHFITRRLPDTLDNTYDPGDKKKKVHVKLTEAKAILSQGKYPHLTVRELPSGARTVWIGGDIDNMFSHQSYRTLLRRAITWSTGYTLFKTWQNKAWMTMDDPGGAQGAWLKSWHYKTLTEQQMDKYLIKPLIQHNAILIVNVNPGFVNDELTKTELAFQRKLTDEFGTIQDHPSTKRGLIKGLDAGVFEIQSHGFTHMQPDLWSPPTWFGSDLHKERAHVGWYREFGDTRRNKEIPAAEALWRMKTSITWLEHLFAVTPLSFRPGGSGLSYSYHNNTQRLAALAGFGFAQGYLGPDIAVNGWDFWGTKESPLMVGAPPDAHDKGIAENPEQFVTIFERYPDMKWMGLNEYVGYIHASISLPDQKDFTLQVHYDPHYCMYFKNHSSNWNLLVADWLAEKINGASVTVDGGTVIKNADFSEKIKIEIPAGLGTHDIRIVQK
jgi:hypothetical protein